MHVYCTPLARVEASCIWIFLIHCCGRIHAAYVVVYVSENFLIYMCVDVDHVVVRFNLRLAKHTFVMVFLCLVMTITKCWFIRKPL